MPSDNMHDLDGWEETTCGQSDLIRVGVKPVSSLTDLDGQFGAPTVYTEWARTTDDEDTPVLRDYRYPGTSRACQHYVPTKENA